MDRSIGSMAPMEYPFRHWSMRPNGNVIQALRRCRGNHMNGNRVRCTLMVTMVLAIGSSLSWLSLSRRQSQPLDPADLDGHYAWHGVVCENTFSYASSVAWTDVCVDAYGILGFVWPTGQIGSYWLNRHRVIPFPPICGICCLSMTWPTYLTRILWACIYWFCATINGLRLVDGLCRQSHSLDPAVDSMTCHQNARYRCFCLEITLVEWKLKEFSIKMVSKAKLNMWKVT